MTLDELRIGDRVVWWPGLDGLDTSKQCSKRAGTVERFTTHWHEAGPQSFHWFTAVVCCDEGMVVDVRLEQLARLSFGSHE